MAVNPSLSRVKVARLVCIALLVVSGKKWLTKNEVKQFEYETNMLDSKENNPDDDFYEKFALTPWGCLHCAFRDFGLDLPEIPGKMADAIMEDFFETMERADIIEKKE